MAYESKQPLHGVDWGAVLTDHAEHLHPVETFDDLEHARSYYAKRREELRPVEWMCAGDHLDVVMWERRRLRASTWRVPATREQSHAIMDWVGELGRDVGQHWSTEPTTLD